MPSTSSSATASWGVAILLLLSSWPSGERFCSAELFTNISGSHGVYAIATSVILADYNVLHVYGLERFSLTLDVRGSSYVDGPPWLLPTNLTATDRFESFQIAGLHKANVNYLLSEWMGSTWNPAYVKITLTVEIERIVQSSEGKFSLIEGAEKSVNLTTLNETEVIKVILKHGFYVVLNEAYTLLMLDKTVYHFGDTVFIWADILRPSNWAANYNNGRSSTENELEEESGNVEEEEEQYSEHYTTRAPATIDRFVEMYNQAGKLVRIWTKKEVRKSRYHLKFKLPDSGAPGQWSIRMVNPAVQLTFNIISSGKVEPDVYIHHTTYPNNLIEVDVCITGTDKFPVAGRLKLLTCSCSLLETNGPVDLVSNRLPTHISHIILQSTACPLIQTDYPPAPCEFTYSNMDTDGCAKVNISSLSMVSTRETPMHGLKQFSLVCVRFYDSPTGMHHAVCKVVADERETWTMPRELEVTPRHYKPGLPIALKVRILSIPAKDTNVEVDIISNPSECPLITQVVGPRPYYLKLDKKVDANNEIELLLPPLKHYGTLSIHLNINTGHIIRGTIGVREPHCYVTLSDEVIQVWIIEDSLSVSDCAKQNGNVTFTLVGNAPLADVHLIAYANNRGSLLELIVDNAPSVREACTDQDGPFGHYTCTSEHEAGKITCRPGWKGDNCLTPICAQQCDQVGGQCSIPGGCHCNPGFGGEWCELCFICGPCNDGFECSCPWYNRTCNINYASHISNSTTPLPEHVNTEDIPKRTIYTREVTLHLHPNLRGDFSVILGYFRNIPSTDRIDFVFTEVKLRKPNTCPDSVTGPGIFFNETSAVIGSKIEIVVLPPTNADITDESTTCHVRVWEVTPDNERMAAQFSRLQLRDFFYRRFDSGFTPKYHTDWILQHSHLTTIQNQEDLVKVNIPYDCIISDDALNRPYLPYIPSISELSFDSIYSTTTKLEQLDSKRGIVHTIDVVPMGKIWRASVFCYGQDIGVWTATTEKDFTIDPGYTFNITGVRHVRVLEKFYLTAHLWTSLLNTVLECYEVTIKFIYDEEHWIAFQPPLHVECNCGADIKSHYQFTIMMQPKLPAKSTTVSAEVSVIPQQCEYNSSSTDSTLGNATGVRGGIQNEYQPDPVLNRMATHVIGVTEGDNLISQWVSLILPHPGSVILPLQIPSTKLFRQDQQNDQTKQGLWVEIVYGCVPMTALIRRFDRLFSTTPLWTVRHHLAILSASITVLHYSTLNFAGSTSSLQPIVAKAILQAHTSATWINRYECPDKAVILGSYIGDCQVPGDPWLLLSVLEVLCEMISIPYPWRTSTMDNYLLLFRVAEYFEQKVGESETGCLKVNTLTNMALGEEDFSLTAKLYVSLSKKIYEGRYERIYALEQALRSNASRCLLKSLPTIDFTTFSTISLSYIARVLQQIKPDHQLTEKVFGEIERRRQTKVNSETNIDESFWSFQKEQNGPGDVETTAIAFLVYIARSDQPEINITKMNIVRWLYQQQDRNGAFSTPQTTIPAISALFQYSLRQKDWINDLKSHLPLIVTIYSPVVGDFKLHGRLLAADRGLGQIRVLHVPAMDPLTDIFVKIHTEQPRDLLSLRISALHETPPPSTDVAGPPKAEHIRVTFLTNVNVSCPLTQVTMCIENPGLINAERKLLLTVSPQSGWDWTSDMHAVTVKSRNVLVLIPSFERVGIDSTQTLRMLLNQTGSSSNCTNLGLQWTGPVLSPQPLTVKVVEQGADEYATTATYTLPNCQLINRTSDVQSVQFQRKPDELIICPDRIRPLDSNPDLIVTELITHCKDYPAFILHFLPMKKGEIPVDVYRIKKFGILDAWPTRLHSTARRCPGLEDDQVLLVLPRTEVDIKPGDKYLNLNAKGLVESPVALLELSDIEQQDAFRILYKASTDCKLFNTVLKTADSLLP